SGHMRTFRTCPRVTSAAAILLLRWRLAVAVALLWRWLLVSTIVAAAAVLSLGRAIIAISLVLVVSPVIRRGRPGRGCELRRRRRRGSEGMCPAGRRWVGVCVHVEPRLVVCVVLCDPARRQRPRVRVYRRLLAVCGRLGHERG
ncbi:hypothetical protein CPB85DRAFT_1360251, partial [Mucidula mucida]